MDQNLFKPSRVNFGGKVSKLRVNSDWPSRIEPMVGNLGCEAQRF